MIKAPSDATYEVVADFIIHHDVLRKKGQKINLGKYHQTTYTGIRGMKVFSLKGFCYSIAAIKSGYWQYNAGDIATSKPKGCRVFYNQYNMFSDGSTFRVQETAKCVSISLNICFIKIRVS